MFTDRKIMLSASFLSFYLSAPRRVGEPPVCASRRFVAGVPPRRNKQEVPWLRSRCAAGQCQTGLRFRVWHNSSLQWEKQNHPTLSRKGLLSLCPFFYNRFLDRFKRGKDFSLLQGIKFNVEFVINRLTLRLQHRAAELAFTNKLGSVLFPSEPPCSCQQPDLPKLRWGCCFPPETLFCAVDLKGLLLEQY